MLETKTLGYKFRCVYALFSGAVVIEAGADRLLIIAVRKEQQLSGQHPYTSRPGPTSACQPFSALCSIVRPIAVYHKMELNGGHGLDIPSPIGVGIFLV